MQIERFFADVVGQNRQTLPDYFAPNAQVFWHCTNECFTAEEFIHINCDLDEYQQKFTCAHELGHALLHPDLSTPFLRESTLFSVDKLEVEANRFAACLCYPPNLLAEEYEGCTTTQIAETLNLPLPLIEYTLK